MSPVFDAIVAGGLNVPRASGDEPGEFVLNKETVECAPRQRG